MRRLLTGCWALALLLSLAAPARADSLWEPNNSFYERHADEGQYLGRSFYANGAEGYIPLWDAPGGYLVKGQFSNGFILWVYYQFEDWVYAVVWGDEGEISGWAPIEDFALEYDHLSFAEEYADAIYPYCGQFADYDGDAEEVVFYEGPGAQGGAEVRNAACGWDEGELSGWAPIEALALEYDHLSFAEEYADAIYPYCGQFADYDGDAEEIVFYEYPGAPVSKDVRKAAWGLDELIGRGGDSYI